MTLIERLEAATGPDRELDLTIYLNLRPESELAAITKYRRGLDSADGYSWDISHGTVIFQKMQDGRCPHNGGYPLPAFTGSLDAAMTLMPKINRPNFPWLAIKSNNPNNPIGCRCELWLDNVKNYNGRGETLAIAICIAALKAREANNEN